MEDQLRVWQSKRKFKRFVTECPRMSQSPHGIPALTLTPSVPHLEALNVPNAHKKLQLDNPIDFIPDPHYGDKSQQRIDYLCRISGCNWSIIPKRQENDHMVMSKKMTAGPLTNLRFFSPHS